MVRLTKKTKGFEDVRWTLKAMSKSPELINGATLNILNASGGTITATDGYRLHQCKSPIPDGNWEIIKNTQSEIILEEKKDTTFPDYSVVNFDVSDIQPFVTLSKYDSFDHALAMVIRGMSEKVSIKYSYLEDTTSLGCHFDLFQKAVDGAVQFVNETHRAFIMPVRI